MENTGTVKANLEERNTEELQERLSIIDFKMVTFSLANKDYAIDIMQVKEIAKAGNFTYVPNTSPFVLGVYNLRGDIIPVIDLRIFFNIPVNSRKKNQIESMVIITVQDQTYGVVVDFIDKVVGVSSNSIQPPHPIFGDINIKYIHGVVENSGRLYILLDVNKIFASNCQSGTSDSSAKISIPQENLKDNGNEVFPTGSDALGVKFVRDTLAAFGKFYPSPVNEDWIADRYAQWSSTRAPSDLQIQSEEDTDEFLSTFLSPCSKRIWSEEYLNSMMKALPDTCSKNINAWNIGCSLGYETYSFAVMLKIKYPNSHIKIFANDSDLLAISGAPMINVPDDLINTLYGKYLVKGVNGKYSFNKEIKDMVLFEYHDCTHQNSIPDVDFILARDVLSFMNIQSQNLLLEEFRDKLKKDGCIILGQNEAMPKQNGWLRHKNQNSNIIIFTKE